MVSDIQSMPDHLRQILDLARWAPSGDNTQPWRFEILDDEHVLVHGLDTRDHVVYDLDGHASQLAHGALLETLSIAATNWGRRARVTRRPHTPESHLLFDVQFARDDQISPDPLFPFIEERVVQRRAMSTRRLPDDAKSAIQLTLPDGYRVIWFEGLARRWQIARFMYDSALVRLIIPEAFQVHRTVIEWGARYSEDRIPELAVGVDPLTARLMRWAMATWSRVEFLNKWMMGTLAPRIQLDLIPGLRCAGHLALIAPTDVVSIDDYVAAGRALQRFWLAATRAGLLVQPEMTPLIFSRFVREGRSFTSVPRAERRASVLNGRLQALLQPVECSRLFFMGRLGYGTQPAARSLRKPLASLIRWMEAARPGQN